jgi:hypothetical protein
LAEEQTENQCARTICIRIFNNQPERIKAAQRLKKKLGRNHGPSIEEEASGSGIKLETRWKAEANMKNCNRCFPQKTGPPMIPELALENRCPDPRFQSRCPNPRFQS